MSDQQKKKEEWVDNRRRLKRDMNPLAWVLWVIGFFISCYAAYLLVVTPAPAFPWLGVLLHVVATALIGGGVGLALSLTDPAGWAWASIATFFTFLVGPIGALLGVFCYLVARGQPTGEPLTEVVKAEMWIRTDEPEEIEDLPPMDLAILEQARVEPIVDLLPYADVTTTIAIINRLKDRANKEDIEMIRQIAQDKRPEVYQYAIAQLSRMERDFNSRIYGLGAEIKAKPAHTELRLELAKVYLEYIESGLLDESLRDYYLELTLAQVLEAMLKHQYAQELAVDVAHLLHYHGLYREASSVAQAALKRDPANLKGQLLVLHAMFERAQEQARPTLLKEAKTRALESGWAVHVPKKRSAGLGPTFDLANFWFEGRKANA